MGEHGYGWWEAGDGNWYPPEQHPQYDPNNSSSYGWWEAADGKKYPPSSHPDYRSESTNTVVVPPPSQPSGAAVAPPGAMPPPNTLAGGAMADGVMAPAVSAPGSKLSPTVIGVLVASVLIIIGSVLPWASIDLGFLSENVGGLDGDGTITLILAIATAALAFFSKSRTTGFAIGALVAASLSALIAVIDITDITSTFDGLGLDGGVSVGIGLWLVLVASLLAMAASVKLIMDCRSN